MQRAEKQEISRFHPDLFNYIKNMKQPDYEFLKSAEGLSIKEIEEDLIRLEGANLAARCVIAERENSFYAQPGREYTGQVYDLDKKIVNQAVNCGYSGKFIAIIKYHSGDILNIKELNENDICTIYRTPNGKAIAERIDEISIAQDKDRCIVNFK